MEPDERHQTHQHEMMEHLAQRTWAEKVCLSLVITHHQAKGIWGCWQVHLQCHSETRALHKFQEFLLDPSQLLIVDVRETQEATEAIDTERRSVANIPVP